MLISHQHRPCRHDDGNALREERCEFRDAQEAEDGVKAALQEVAATRLAVGVRVRVDAGYELRLPAVVVVVVRVTVVVAVTVVVGGVVALVGVPVVAFWANELRRLRAACHRGAIRRERREPPASLLAPGRLPLSQAAAAVLALSALSASLRSSSRRCLNAPLRGDIRYARMGDEATCRKHERGHRRHEVLAMAFRQPMLSAGKPTEERFLVHHPAQVRDVSTVTDLQSAPCVSARPSWQQFQPRQGSTHPPQPAGAAGACPRHAAGGAAAGAGGAACR